MGYAECIFAQVKTVMAGMAVGDSASEYIGKVWPEFADHFPKQEELPSLVEKGVVFFGPFTGW